MIALLPLWTALAAADDAPETPEAPASDWGLVLAGGLGGGGGPPSADGFVVGRATLRLGKVALAFGGREGVATADTRTIGGIFAGLQGATGKGTYLRGGFAHHHETPWEAFLEAPGGSFAGVSDAITHRSGFEVGGGWGHDLAMLGLGDWLGMALDGSVTALPDRAGSPVYLNLEFLFTVRAH